MTSQHSDLSLVQRVFDRITAAGTDDELQAELDKYLAPVINKLNSSNDAVRTTIVEMLGHVNRRIKDHQHIQLPVEALLGQFSAPGASAFVVNFSLVYIRMGFPRLDSNKQVELLPKLLESLEGKPAHQQDSVLVLLLPVLGHIKGSTHLLPDSPLMKLKDKPAIAKLLLDYMQDILLLPYGGGRVTQQQLLLKQEQRRQEEAQQQQQAAAAAAEEAASGSAEEGQPQQTALGSHADRRAPSISLHASQGPPESESVPVAGVPAGMSIYSFTRAQGEVPLEPEQLEKLKLTVIKFLDAQILSPNAMALAVIIASSDTRFSVANAAESLLRRLDATIEWNSSAVISAMYVLFLGTLTPIQRGPLERFKNPANTRIRLKLMPCLLKSREATNYAPLAVKVFCECLWGSHTNSRLKQQGITFLHHISSSATTEKIKPVGSMLFSGIVKVIDEEKNNAKLTSLAYGALAKLSLKLPNLLLSHESQLHYLQTLMDALTHEVGDVLLAIQEALSMVAPVCKHLSANSQEQLCILLSSHVQHNNPALRRTAVHYAASVFSRTHFASRFILLLATGDSQDDIRLEATRELYRPVKDDDSAEYVSPSFSSMVSYTIERMNDQPRSNWRDVANTPLPYSLKVMEELLLYLQHCLSIESKSSSSNGSSKLAVTLFREGTLMWPDCCGVGRFVTKELERPREGLNPYLQYLGLCEMVANAWSAVGVEAMVRLICVVPALLSPQYTGRTDWLRRVLLRGGHAGQIAALLFGAVTGQIEDQTEFERAVQSIRNIKELRQDSQLCCILATGHSLAFTQHRLLSNDDVVLEDEWTFFAQTLRQLVTDLVNSDSGLQLAYISAIADVARFTNLPVSVGDLNSLKESEPSVESTEVDKAVDSESSSSSVKALPIRSGSKKDGTLVELFCVLKAVYENNKLSSKVREQAIQCAGHLCVGQPDLPLKPAIIRSLLRFAHESDELEIHFSVGGALADSVLGSASSSALNLWTQPDPNADSDQEKKTEPRNDKDELMDVDTKKDTSDVSTSDEKPLEVGSLSWLLDQLLNVYVPMTKPSVRQASCIWLLTVLKRCRLCAEVQRSLPLIQSAFMNLLADNNELVQDAASKGLCVVYECCSEDIRRSMVEGLVHALTEGKSRVTNVTSNTKLFREGELGTAPSGGQLSTYRELCSLASDLNQPDLVYKFMNLANHNAIWNSRKGAAFGFGSLAQQAGAQLEPFLPAIVPKLFRYQHDPTPRIQQPMAHIWSCLVSDTTKTTEKYYSAILEDLLSNLTSTLWRVRESCCGALADLVRQHSVVPAVPHLPAIWAMLFRVRDDIKESVRTAANKTLQGLSKSCIKVCESGGEDGQRVLESVLPILLTDGITSSVAEVRSISLDAIVQVCRSGGAMIRLHLGTLVPALLEAIAGLEHKSLSYTAVRTTAEEDRDRFDSIRVAASRSTPMMDTLNYVLQFVDEEVMDAVVAGVVDVLKRSVGLTSRTAAAHVVETLTHTCPGPLEKHTGKILSVLVNGLNDRNATVRKVFANAIGTLIKIAKHSSVTKLLNKLESWYLEKEEDSVRYSCALALRSMHRQSGDIMRDHASIALPLAYLAMHALKTVEDDPTGAEVWEEIWSDNTPGTEAGLKLYLREILQVCEKAAGSPNWAMKAQSGKTISALSSKVGSLLVQDQVQALVTLLLSCLQGRTWAGKENLLLALSTVAVEAKPVLSSLKSTECEDPLIDEIVKVLLREANKEKKDYKMHAVRALTIVLQEYQVDKFDVVFDICSSLISQSIETNTSSSSASSGVITEEERAAEQQEENVKWKLLEEFVVSLGRAWPVAKCRDTQERYSVCVVELLSASISKVPRTTQLSVVSTLGRYWERHYLLLHTAATTAHLLIRSASDAEENKDSPERGSSPLFDPLLESQFDPALQHSCKIFNYCLGISKYYSLRKEALTVLRELLQRIKGNELLVAKISRLVLAAVEEARRDAQPDIQDLAISLHKILVT